MSSNFLEMKQWYGLVPRTTFWESEWFTERVHTPMNGAVQPCAASRWPYGASCNTNRGP
jgi:hypothetical protein